ncbi:MAG: pseudouridine synthase [Candidatus Fimimorpha sp.]
MDEIRLNKYLSERGVCSRREADRLAEAGKITVNGNKAFVGMKVLPTDEIIVDGKAVEHRQKKRVLLAVNKPKGIVCTTARFKGEKNIVDMIQYPIRVYPIGRLDKDSEGLILMTNDGEIVNAISRSRNNHEKEYVVTVNKPVTEKFLDEMRNGVKILDTVTKPCICKRTGAREFHIILTQGLNRQIRRMCEACGYRVEELKRIRIMNIQLGNIPLGHFRNVSETEQKQLEKLCNIGEEL